jgi:hypothetical protein
MACPELANSLRADHAGCAGAVCDHDLLAEAFRQLVGIKARHDVDGSPRCDRRDDCDQAVWILVLRTAKSGPSDQNRGRDR